MSRAQAKLIIIPLLTRDMKIYVVCLAFIASAAAQTVVDPRGARPVVPNTRSEKCASVKEWPFCTDDDWGPKCPSGCRIQGLLEKYDHGFLKRTEKIRGLLDQNQAKHRSTDQVSKQTYDFLREKLTIDSGNDNNYYDMAQTLRQRISEMKIKIDSQLRILAALKDRVKNQVVDMKRLEVDIDMKLRTCKGSCKKYNVYEVDHEGYVALDKQMNQLNTLSEQNIETVGTLHVMKSRPLRDAVVDSVFKSGGVQVAQQKTEDVFPDVKTVQLFLEVEGSSSSPATISKVPGTSLSPSTSSSSSSTSHKSITEIGGGDPFGFGGGGFESLGQPSVSTKSISCTKRVRTVVVDTGDGPVQKTEEYYEGGPECQSYTKGGMGALFPTLTSGTKTVHLTSSAKGAPGDSKTAFVDPFSADVGLDLGAFMTGDLEDDVPDFQARSVKSARVERQADYVGKVCLRLKQQTQNGRHSPGYFHRKQQYCGRKSNLALCADDDWIHRCPSGCRMQGLILENEKKFDDKLRTICKTAKTYEDAAEKSMSVTARFYHKNRASISNASMWQVQFVESIGDLSKNLTLLRKRSAKLTQQTNELREKVQKQVKELLRTEVDIDVLLRSCLGSCHAAPSFSIDLHEYETLRFQPKPSTMKSKDPENLPQIRLVPADYGPEPSPVYKTIKTVLDEGLNLFEDVKPYRVIVEDNSE